MACAGKPDWGYRVRSFSEKLSELQRSALERVWKKYKDYKLAEIEAHEACRWLKAAGFPQYAQMYEDGHFPVDIASVEKDHDFLDEDSLQALFRRLNTLNRCVTMKIERPVSKVEDSDEEGQCALSDKWKFEQSIRRWSRCDLPSPTLLVNGSVTETPGIRSCSSHDSLLSDDEAGSNHDSPPAVSRTHHLTIDTAYTVPRSKKQSPFPSPDSALSSGSTSGKDQPIRSPRLVRAASERLKGAKNFLKRMESFKSKKKKKQPATPQKMEIGQPVLVENPETQARINQLGCVEIITAQHGSGSDGDAAISDSDCSPMVEKRVDRVFMERSISHDPAMHSENSSSQPSAMHSTHEDSQMIVDPQYKPGGFPRVLANGCIEVVDGSQINYRTGSFNFGADSQEFRQSILRRSRTDAPRNVEHRQSIYDNVPPVADVDPQKELDLILQDLYKDINGLSQSLAQHDQGISGGQQRKEESPAPNIVFTLETSDLDEDFISLKPITKLTLPQDTNQNTSTEANRELGLDISVVADRLQRTGLEDSLNADDSASLAPSVEVEQLLQNAERLKSDSGVSGVSTDLDTSITSPQHVHDDICDCDIDLDAVLGEDENSADFDQVVLRGSFIEEERITRTVEPAERKDDKIVVDVSPSDDSIVMCNPDHSPLGMREESRNAMEGVGYQGIEQDHASGSSGTSSNQESSEGDGEKADGHRERRDSGVGSSLTRVPSDKKRHRIRWHSFVKSHRPSLNSQSLQLASMPVSKMLMLHKYSLLRLTATMEKYTPSSRSWNLNMPKFLKRSKAPDFSERNIFGIPLLLVLQRTGQPLPQCILYAMRCLRRTAKDAVGIFRKSGVRSRIQKLRDQLESNPASVDFESLQSYDVADVVKQYFRELPECLLTNKFSETFTNIYMHVPEKERLAAVQCAVIQLPDEHREVLHSLLLFLSDMAKHSTENQMTASNLAVCFCPSLFNMYGPKSPQAALSPKRARKLTVGVPDQKELLEQKAALDCLTHMIENCKRLFMVPVEALSHIPLASTGPEDAATVVIPKASSGAHSLDYAAVMEGHIQELLKESREKFKGWSSLSHLVNQVEVSYKKVTDTNPLRYWRVCTDIEAPPIEVLNKLLRERGTWDDDFLEGRTLERLDKQMEVYLWTTNSMAPHPGRDFVELRHWRTDVAPKGACVLVSKSADHPESPANAAIRGTIFASHYLIEPCGAGKSRVNHIARVDIRGHTPDWYNKCFGHLCANLLARVRESFKQGLSATDGPETKV